MEKVVIQFIILGVVSGELLLFDMAEENKYQFTYIHKINSSVIHVSQHQITLPYSFVLGYLFILKITLALSNTDAETHQFSLD